MNRLIVFALLALIINSNLLAQEYIKHKEPKKPAELVKEVGTVYKSPTDSAIGELSYDRKEVILHSNGSETKYKPTEITGFALTKGKRRVFFSFKAPGKSDEVEFYENLTPKGTKLYIIKLAPHKMKKIETEPDGNPLKYIPEAVHLYIYGIAEKAIVATDLEEMTQYMKAKCKGIGDAMEIKEPSMHFGAGASEEKRFNVYNNVIYQYEHDKCGPLMRY